MLRFFKGFRKSEEGVAAIEFALIAPLLFLIFFGVVEFSKYTTLKRRAEITTQLSAEYLSRDDNDRLRWFETHTALAIPSFTNPAAYEEVWWGWRGRFSMSFASVEFERDDPDCAGVDCTFTPNVLWNTLTHWRHKDLVRNSCEMEIVKNDVALDGEKLPEGMVGRGGIVRADAVYVYKPFLTDWILPEFPFYLNAIRKTRSGVPLANDATSDNKWTDLCYVNSEFD